MKLQIKRLCESAKLPTRGSEEAACFDLYVSEDTTLFRGIGMLVPTGIAMGIPEGFCVKIHGRSSMIKRNIEIHTGIVDSDYTGEVMVQAMYGGNKPCVTVKAGERIGQFMLTRVTETELVEVDELRTTARGDKGFGSTGR